MFGDTLYIKILGGSSLSIFQGSGEWSLMYPSGPNNIDKRIRRLRSVSSRGICNHWSSK